MRELTLAQARRVQLHAQGLLAAPKRRARKADVLDCIRRMGALQIDTIHVVARSPYLVLFSRLGAYRQEWLDELLADGDIYEYWSHEACFLPVDDYPLHAWRHRSDGTEHWSARFAHRMLASKRKAMHDFLAQVRERGPVKAADFERTGKKQSGWWDWKAEKLFLEAWFALGELMVVRREHFHRVYDLRERVLGERHASVQLTHEEAMRGLALRAIRALGVTPARWVHDYFRTRPRLKDADLAPLVDDGTLLRVPVEGSDAPWYAHADAAPLLAQAAQGRLRATHTTLLSPFDPLVWDRERAAALFDFDYRIECYTPAPKRRYGYYVLPVLRRGKLVARLDAKAHRAEGVFEVKAFHVEPDEAPDEAWIMDVGAAIARCADWHATPRVKIARTPVRGLASALTCAACA